MWYGFDADVRRELAAIKKLTARRYQTPAHEWAVAFVEEHHALLVVRQWSNGDMTAYACAVPSDPPRE
jgi:hypothetical protein